MMNGKRILLLIPARGGSKRLPHKNILPLGGKPMIAYAIEAARGVPEIDRVLVSTDDEEIATVAKKFFADVPFKRPVELASDTALSVDVWRHAVVAAEAENVQRYDILMLVQPTSPLVQSTDISAVLKELLSSNCRSCVTMCAVRERPEWMFHLQGKQATSLNNKNDLNKRHQDLEPLYRPNGAVYASLRTVVMDEKQVLDPSNLHAVLMPVERSVDVDTQADFDRAQQFLQNV